MMADKSRFIAWLTRKAEERRAAIRLQRYYDARCFEEWHVPFDAKPVSPESAEIVAALLGSIRLEWQRKERAR